MNVRGGFAAGPQHTVESVSGDLSIETTTGLTVDTNAGLTSPSGTTGQCVVRRRQRKPALPLALGRRAGCSGSPAQPQPAGPPRRPCPAERLAPG